MNKFSFEFSGIKFDFNVKKSSYELDEINEIENRLRIKKEKDKFERLMNLSGIEVRNRKSFYDVVINDKNKKLIEILDASIKNNELLSFILAGATGAGKTFIISTYILEMIKNDNIICLVNSAKLFFELESSKRFGSELSQKDILNQIINVKSLIFDDFGTEKIDKEIMYYIIDSRYQKNLHTSIITNYDMKTLKSMYGERTIHRLNEMTKFKIQLNDKDWRLKD